MSTWPTWKTLKSKKLNQKMKIKAFNNKQIIVSNSFKAASQISRLKFSTIRAINNRRILKSLLYPKSILLPNCKQNPLDIK